MKHLLLLIINLLIWFIQIWKDLVFILWYGQLPKVSTYHANTGMFDLKECYTDEFAQSAKYKWNVLNDSKINDTLYDILVNDPHLPETITIRNNKGEIIIEQDLYGYITEKLSDKIKKSNYAQKN